MKNFNQIIKKKLKEYTTDNVNFAEWLADKMIYAIGSWLYVFIFCLILVGWILLNIYLVKYDPYPFILLNLVLSCIAALQVSIILMSQNRMSEIDRKRDELTYTINLKDELISEDISKKLDKTIEYLRILYIMKKFHLLDMGIIYYERKVTSKIK